MEDLINQMRVRVSGGGQGKAAGSSSSIPRERRVPINKTLTFKGEKRTQSWFGRQFSRQPTRGGLGPADELAATAVAAATFVVNSLEDSKGTTSPKPAGLSPQESSLTKAKSRKDEATRPPEPGPSSSLRPSETQAGSPNLQRSPTFADHLSEKFGSRSQKIPTPPPPPLPSQSSKKPATPTFPASSTAMRPETSSMNHGNKPASAPSSKPHPKSTAGLASRGGSRADVWEATEMEKIKEVYEKLSATIASWEEGRKKKAKAKLDNTERGLARRRSRAMQKFKEEMESIDRIAGGARAQAEEKQRNKESKAKEKANKYRRTGKFPRTCFCF